MTFLAKVCAARKPINFINLLFLRCTVPFAIKEVCALSLIPSLIVLLLKGCWGLLHYLLFYLCGRFIDFQSFGFYGILGHVYGFFVFAFFLIASIFDNFARNSRLFLSVCNVAFFRLALRQFYAYDFCLMMAANLYAILATAHLL